MILQGDCRERMRELPAKSVQCCVTSPPYLWVRDYGVPPTEWPEVTYAPMPGLPPITVTAWIGCLGLEPTPEMFVAHIVLVFREVWRVLRDDGTLWLNFGDTYAGSQRGRNADGRANPGGIHKQSGGQTSGVITGKFKASKLKPKDLIGIPWRVAFALQADGWYLRMDNIWNKLNCMPESTDDRPTKAHEYIFLFSKRRRYYYDAEAIREPAAYGITPTGVGFGHGTDAEQRERGRITAVGGSKGAFGPEQSRRRSGNKERKYGDDRGRPGSHIGSSIPWEGSTRNKRSVWTMASSAGVGAHFATFPENIPEIAILAGSSPQACPHCGAPWRRLTERVKHNVRGKAHKHLEPLQGSHGSMGHDGAGMRYDASYEVEVKTVGWEATCKCQSNDGSAKCVVLDPFGGSGTVGKVSAENDRDYILIELNPEYVAMGERRTAVIQPKMQLL